MNNIEDNFYKKYCENILSKIMVFEPQRKKMRNILIIKELLLFILIMLSLFYIIFIFDKTFTPVGAIIVVLFLIIAIFTIIGSSIYIGVIFKGTTENFKQLIKNTFTNDLTKDFAITWSCKQALSKISIEESNIFPGYSNFEYDDIFHGVHNDVEFDVQEIRLLGESDAAGTVFKGVVLCMPSNKTVNAKTIVTSKKDLNILNRWRPLHEIFITSVIFISISVIATYILLKNSISIDNVIHVFGLGVIFLIGIYLFYSAINQIKKEKLYKKISLEDLNFDKRFNVYSEDQVEARYLITTAFMERLVNLQTAFGTKDIKCSFFKDKVMFAISTNKDLFEIGNLFVPLTDKKQIEIFYKELNSIYNMIDYFKLTQKTGL